MTFVSPPKPEPKRSRLIDRARLLLIALREKAGSDDPIPPIDSRADARAHLPGNGPFMHFTVTPKKRSRRTTTRGKRQEQRGRARI